MIASNYDTVIVGAGCAGLTAAIGLARAGFAVVVVEAAEFPGAENWSGCVYFCESLAHPDILGPQGVESLAWERRLVERGVFATDGHGLLGMTYRDPDAFRHCYTVLRPVFDAHLAHLAEQHGVALLRATTVESLVREEGRVVGVCTNRGPLYADLVFLAEGDASHLVAREGYEPSYDRRVTPHFLLGLKQVIDLPPGGVEQAFGLGPEEGGAYELLLRNATLRGRPARLNLGGFVYTNRQGLSLGLVLPADNLYAHFDGEPGLLLDWLANLPALRPWLRGGQRGVYGAKLIRGGGARDIPHLIDHGLAIGGAASALGVTFPYTNFIGPATAMGLLLTQAACRIREEGSRFTRAALERHYLQPLRQTHFWKDVDFLRHWPGYVQKTRVLFDRGLDLALGTAHVWTRPRHWLLGKWFSWLWLLCRLAGPTSWRELRVDWRRLQRAVRLREIAGHPALGRLLLDGALNALRDLFRRPRKNLAPGGVLRWHYAVAGGVEPSGPPPAPLRRWFQRFVPVLASAARQVYANNARPLAEKLPDAIQTLVRQINLFDLLAAAGVGLAAGMQGALLLGFRRLGQLFRRRQGEVDLAGHASSVRQPLELATTRDEETRKAPLVFFSDRAVSLHVLQPPTATGRPTGTLRGPWRICPTRVFNPRAEESGPVQITVHAANCLTCAACWRTSELVDGGRDGTQRFLYPVESLVRNRLLEAVRAAGLPLPARPRTLDTWGPVVAPQEESGAAGELSGLLEQLEQKLREFDEALAEGPRTIDADRAEYLEMLARYAHQLGLDMADKIRGATLNFRPDSVERQRFLTAALVARLEERARRTWDRHFSWAAADGRQIRAHHLVGLCRLLGKPNSRPADAHRAWLRAEDAAAAARERLPAWNDRLELVCAHARSEHVAPTPEQDAALGELVAEVPPPTPAVPHPPLRKALLSELSRRAPALAYRAAAFLETRDALHPALANRMDRARLTLRAADRISIASGLADALCEQAREGCLNCGASESREGEGSGALRVARMAAWHYLIETLDHNLSPSDFSVAASEQALLIEGLVGECLGMAAGSLAYEAAQLLGAAADSQDDPLARFCREAAAWCPFGSRHRDVYQRWGEQLLRSWQPAGTYLASLGEDHAFDIMRQRRALQAEQEQVDELEARLHRLVTDWVQRPAGVAESSPAGQDAASTPDCGGTAEVAERLGAQDARLLAAKALLLRTHARLEHGLLAETAIPLLQIWFEEIADSQAKNAGFLRQLHQEPAWREERPLVELGAVAPVATYADFLAASGAYESGDFLARPLDLEQPRLVPELLDSDPTLAARRQEILDRVAAQCGAPAGALVERAAAEETGCLPAEVTWRSLRVAEDRFILASVGWEFLGRCEHPQTRSLRLEGEITRLLTGALLLEMGAALGEVRTVAARSSEDSLRLQILKELATQVIPRRPGQPVGATLHYVGREVLEVEALRRRLHEILTSSWAVCGPRLWEDWQLWPAGFLLAEATAWLKAAESVLYRLAWRSRREQTEESAEPARGPEAGSRALARCQREVRRLLTRLDRDLARLRGGHHAPVVRAAALLRQPARKSPAPPPRRSRITRPLAVLVLVWPQPVGNPPLQPYQTWSDADRAALETALRLRDDATAPVTIRVAAVGHFEAVPLLREALSLGAEAVNLILSEKGIEKADATLALASNARTSFDLILFGSGEDSRADFVALYAGPDYLFAGTASQMLVSTDGVSAEVVLCRAGSEVARPLPAAVAIEPGLALRAFTIDGYLHGLAREIEVAHVPSLASPAGAQRRESSASGVADSSTG